LPFDVFSHHQPGFSDPPAALDFVQPPDLPSSLVNPLGEYQFFFPLSRGVVPFSVARCRFPFCLYSSVLVVVFPSPDHFSTKISLTSLHRESLSPPPCIPGLLSSLPPIVRRAEYCPPNQPTVPFLLPLDHSILPPPKRVSFSSTPSSFPFLEMSFHAGLLAIHLFFLFPVRSPYARGHARSPFFHFSAT